MRQSLIAHTSQSACGSGYRIALRLAIGKARNLIASCFRVPALLSCERPDLSKEKAQNHCGPRSRLQVTKTTSLRLRVLGLWALSLIACIAVGALLALLYQQSTPVRVERAEANNRPCVRPYSGHLQYGGSPMAGIGAGPFRSKAPS